jgi:Domain amino terminal to FKBP-type peptidyl-prolyl isomerase
MKHVLTTLIALIVFVDGALAFDTEQQDLSYSVGIGIVHMMTPERRALVDPNALVLGFKAAIANAPPKYTPEQINKFISTVLGPSDKNERSRIMAANKDLLGYWMGSNIGKAIIISKKTYDFNLLARGMSDEFANVPHAISTKRLAQVLENATQKEQQALGVHKN